MRRHGNDFLPRRHGEGTEEDRGEYLRIARMSTILKALKKAEEGMAQNTLPGKILAADSNRAYEDMRTHNRRRAVILLSLLAVAAGGVYYYYMKPHERMAVATDVSRPAASAPTAAPIRQGSAQENVAPPPLRLSGVLWDDTKPIAILNGKPLAVGGEIDGARVVKIGLDGVKIRYNEREYTLTVE
jgi:hypothetical protein